MSENSLLDPDAVVDLERQLAAEQCAGVVVQRLRPSGLFAAIEAIFLSEAREWPSLVDRLLAQMKAAGSDALDEEQAVIAALVLAEGVGIVAHLPGARNDTHTVAAITRRLAPPLVAAVLRDRGWAEDRAERTAATIVERRRFDFDPVERDRIH
jgi:hypothetical protein